MIFKKIIYSNKKKFLKDAANSTEGITRSTVNYLCKRKSEYSRNLLHSKTNGNAFVDSFFFRFWPLYLTGFLFRLHFCILSHFEIIKCIVKSFIATSMYFLLKYNWKRKLEKRFLGARVWALKTVYRSPKQPECDEGDGLL